MSRAANLGLPTAISRLPQFSEENTQLWSRCWVAAGVEEMIREPGELLPATIGDHGVHVLRDAQGHLDGGYNAFQQGSCWSIPAQCSNGAKVDCAYVSCGHSRDGDVLRPGVSENRLIRQMVGARPSRRIAIGVATAGPVIFVALPGHEPAPLGDQTPEGVAALTSAAPDLRFHSYFHVDAVCNWRYVPARLAYAMGASDAGSDASVSIPSQDLPDGLRPTLSGGRRDLRSALLISGFPNLTIAELPTHRAILIAKPVHRGRTEVTVALYGRGSQPASWPIVEHTWRQLIETLPPAAGETDSPVARWAAHRCTTAGAGRR